MRETMRIGRGRTGRWRVVAAVAGSLALNWYFTDPIHTLTISDAENAAALADGKITPADHDAIFG